MKVIHFLATHTYQYFRLFDARSSNYSNYVCRDRCTYRRNFGQDYQLFFQDTRENLCVDCSNPGRNRHHCHTMASHTAYLSRRMLLSRLVYLVRGFCHRCCCLLDCSAVWLPTVALSGTDYFSCNAGKPLHAVLHLDVYFYIILCVCIWIIGWNCGRHRTIRSTAYRLKLYASVKPAKFGTSSIRIFNKNSKWKNSFYISNRTRDRFMS
jgi:hypothetical protein